MSKKCKYRRESEQSTYVPSCCMSEEGPTNDVCPYEAEEYSFCPFCGRKVKLKEEY